MKKIFFALAVIFSCGVVSAQIYTEERTNPSVQSNFNSNSPYAVQSNGDERSKGTISKKGRQILPQAGDYAIGIDASPALKYLGNFLNKTENNNVNNFFDGPKDTQTVFIKYFYRDDVAVRAKINFGFNSEKTITPTPKFSTNPTNEMVDNSERISNNGLQLSFGYEMRRGYGRLQGFFGPEIALGYGSKSTKNTYGNALSEQNNYGEEVRVLLKSQSSFNFGLGGFAGVEYFVLPKVSIAGELGCNLGFKSLGKDKMHTERWDSELKTKRIRGGSSSNLNFNTAYNATLSVNFYF